MAVLYHSYYFVKVTTYRHFEGDSNHTNVTEGLEESCMDSGFRNTFVSSVVLLRFIFMCSVCGILCIAKNIGPVS